MMIKIETRYIPFILIIFFVMLNALYNSLAVAYGMDRFPYNTFLFYASDLHADLVKMAMGSWHNVHVDTSSWEPLYQKFYDLYRTGFFEKHHFNNDHLPPLPFLISLMLGKVLQNTSPSLLVGGYYFLAFLTIASVAFYLRHNRYDFYVLLFGILLSYPVLMVLSRGNLFSFISSFGVILFLLFLHQKKNPWLTVFLLVLSIHFRPNLVLLSILFFIYPVKYALRYIVGTFVLFAVSFFTALEVSHSILPQYSLDSFIAGLHNYVNVYVTGHMGVLFNNSLYGAIRSLSIAWHHPFSVPDLLLCNTLIALAGVASLFFALFLYIRSKINEYEFIFIVVSVTTLSTTIFATYHLAIYLFFILMGFKENFSNLSIHYGLILFATIFLLVPKNYLFFDFIYKDFLSAETILNPLFLLLALIVFLVKSHIHSLGKIS